MVVVLRELQRAIIYTRELSKQVSEGHVSTAFIAYSVDEDARLTSLYVTPSMLFATRNLVSRLSSRIVDVYFIDPPLMHCCFFYQLHSDVQ
jgi:hypothetical protein